MIFTREMKMIRRSYKKSIRMIAVLLQRFWTSRKTHMNKNGIPCTVFPLNCCYQDTCPHTLCQQGKPPESREVWCEGGPPLSFIPLPMKNEQRPYGWADCQKCPSGKCTAHFLASSQVLKLKQSDNPFCTSANEYSTK